LLAVVTGYEVGATLRPLKGLSLSVVGFLLDLTSELVFNGGTGTTNASGATRRYGAEVVGRYHFRRDIYADAELTLTHARYRDDAGGEGTYVPLAPVRTFAAGIGAAEPLGPLLVSGAVRVKSMADRPASTDGHLTASGFTLVDLQAGARWKNLEIVVDVLNLTDTLWREGQFEVTSRLPNERKPVSGVSFTPGWPREVLGHVALYW
jgi:outer membrane receptor protein involved in Fe transport